MQRRKVEKVEIILLAALVLMYILPVDTSYVAAITGSFWWTFLVCHFFHANIFHLAANIYVLLSIRYSLKELAWAYLIGIVSVLVAAHPVVGASGIIYALLGFRMAKCRSWKIWICFSICNAATFFIPSIAFGVHAAAFCMGLLVKMITEQYGDYRRIIKGK